MYCRLNARWLVCLAVLGMPGSPHANEIAPPVRTFLSSFCTECHNADRAEGDLNLAALASGPDAGPDGAATLAAWERIFTRIRTGEMPPPDSPQPSDAERRQILAAIAEPLHRAVTKRQAVEGRVPLRRLTRVE